MWTSRFSPVTAFAGRTASVARQDARAVVEADVVAGPLAKGSRKAPANATIPARHIPLLNTDPTGPNSYTRSTGCRKNRAVGQTGHLPGPVFRNDPRAATRLNAG